MPANKEAPYKWHIEQDLQGRKTWNEKDNLIIKRRLGERSTTSLPYPGAPNPIVNIIDDTVRIQTDTEISMIMNAPRLAYFIPIGDVPPEKAREAELAFDTLLRHYMNSRRRKEEAVDTKNARGFAVCKVIFEKDPDPSAMLFDMLMVAARNCSANLYIFILSDLSAISNRTFDTSKESFQISSCSNLKSSIAF